MAADKQFWRLLKNGRTNQRIVFTWVTANVRKPYLYTFAQKLIVLRKQRPYFIAINISPYGTQGFEVLQFIYYFERTNIAGMPHVVAGSKMFENPLIEHTMRVRK